MSTDVLEVHAASIALIMEAARTSETLVDNYFTRQYVPEDKSEENEINGQVKLDTNTGRIMRKIITSKT
jgi:hypothetical protein